MGVSFDQVGVVDIGVIQVLIGLYLGLNGLNDFIFIKDLVVDFDIGDFFECFGQDFRFVRVCWNVFGQDVDFYFVEWLSCFDELLYFCKLFVF